MTVSSTPSYDTTHYNLDAIISVGYRVKSQQGVRFRIWATQRLKEYIVKGFALNDERFKSGSSMNYFTELQERIRDVRSIGHFGTGDLEITIKSAEDFERAKPYIVKSFDAS